MFSDENLNSAENGYLDVVYYLIEHGADIHADSENALINSAANGHLNVVEQH
jgi:ankyrin repeat protein